MKADFDITTYRENYNLPVENVDHTWEFIDYKDFQLFFQMFSPPKAEKTILFLHGFFDHTGTHSEWIQYLMTKKFNVAAFDLPGHGQSGGPPFEVESFQEYQEALRSVLEYLREQGVTDVHGVGHSTGGAVIADYLLSNSTTLFHKAALISPLIRSNKWWLSKMAAPLVSTFQKEMPRTFRRHTGESSFMKSLKQDPLEGKTIPFKWVNAMFEWEKEMMEKTPSSKPVLILQGTNDQTVEWKHNMNVYHTLFPESTRILIDNGRHHLLNERKAQKDIIYRLLLEYLNKE
ncbi:alpha/beta hydrolase [Salibacterium salarium]|uniref:Alpha/beta hydrolase n=1 Tax=Salibacterium salarium TaxID=284579 RepID=A0A3R9RBG5_9BACI|nr:alpha/beta hydrolase [Salibacterium salarium]RSL31646.1 alpha/beta hydrolase [Salibacterium salarium]